MDETTGRRLVVADNTILGVLTQEQSQHVFTAFEPALQKLNGYRFRSAEVAQALLVLLARGPVAERVHTGLIGPRPQADAA